MHSSELTKRIENLVFLALVSVTLFVAPLTNLDPINVPKLLVLSTFAFGAGALLLSNYKNSLQENRLLISLISLFMLMFVVTILFTEAPVNQQFFGTYARNTGLLAYLSFSILLLSTANLTSIRIIDVVCLAALVTFIANSLFGLIQYIGLDPFNWVKAYSPITGTFGNPNFISSFLGMGIGFSTSLLFSKQISKLRKMLLTLIILIAFIIIILSKSLQGLIVAAISFLVIGFMLIKFSLNRRYLTLSYMGISILLASLIIFGMLNKGPFSELLYKPSVTYRGDYWRAGLEMIKNQFPFGVGVDSYGDWYRQFRTYEAVIRRGPTAVTDTAHNVFVDIASTVGLLALLCYVMIIILGLKSAFRIYKSLESLDPIYMAILVMWLGYLAQSFISINNLALGIWGWVLPGALIALEKFKIKQIRVEKKKIVLKENLKIDFSSMVMITGLTLGGLIGFFPFNADANFKHSLQSGNSDKIINAIYKWPTDTSRFLYGSQVFSDNSLNEQAIKIARDTVKNNPRSFNAWYFLYNSESVSNIEKKNIIAKLRKLDPNNPELKK